jgi:hypothetical protein
MAKKFGKYYQLGKVNEMGESGKKTNNDQSLAVSLTLALERQTGNGSVKALFTFVCSSLLQPANVR